MPCPAVLFYGHIGALRMNCAPPCFGGKNIKKILNYSQIKKIKDVRLNSRPADLKPDIYYKITRIFEKGL